MKWLDGRDDCPAWHTEETGKVNENLFEACCFQYLDLEQAPLGYTYWYVRHCFSDPFSHVEGSSLVFSFLAEVVPKGKLRVRKAISPRPTTSTLTGLFNPCLLTLLMGTYCASISISQREELVRGKDEKADRSHITEDLECWLRILDFLL